MDTAIRSPRSNRVRAMTTRELLDQYIVARHRLGGTTDQIAEELTGVVNEIGELEKPGLNFVEKAAYEPAMKVFAKLIQRHVDRVLS